ncbi:phosphatase PAP2 family protein [Pelagibius sp. Alg239-R121]|uniref:phosphatase PAP2 family protein n=1 Tax=Pelagibius sp. Alg239-R121 TaxID=2993448 RepID=UPI0024A67AE5|nr:phosphatase PAP2 family protein [Pelagibius sp. Alg239-R121]
MLSELNHSFFLFLNADSSTPWLLVQFASIFAEAPQFILAMMLVYSWLRDPHGGWPIVVRVASTMTLALIFSKAIGMAYPVDRPFVIGLGNQWLEHSPDPSFPSDHATLLFAISCACLGRPGWPTVGWTALILGVVNGWARVTVGLHYPLDILAALGVGLASAVIVSQGAKLLSVRNIRLLQRNINSKTMR